jgi:hypothetical protein
VQVLIGNRRANTAQIAAQRDNDRIVGKRLTTDDVSLATFVCFVVIPFNTAPLRGTTKHT